MYNFDVINDRSNTNCLKFDFAKENNMPDDLVSMWIADMDFMAPECISDALREYVNKGIFGYSDPKDDYFEVVIAWFKKHFNWEIRKEWIVKTPGVVIALALAVKAFTQKGEAVIIQPPVYYPFYNVIRNNERKIIESPLVYKDGEYTIDFEDFENKIKENDVKLFIMCSPHNPVCRVWTKNELQKLGAICKKYNLFVVADEIHCDFVYPGFEHTPFMLACPDLADRMVICTAPSKTFNIAGLQMSNIVIPGEETRALYEKEVLSGGHTCSNAMGIIAAKAAYEGGEEWYKECFAYIRANLDYVRDFIKENLPSIKLIEPQGTYFAWLDCSGLGMNKDELNDFIVNKAKLWLDGGHIFGESSELFQRIVLACPRATVEKAMKNLKKAVDELK